jgi:hypothetical protein
MDQDPAAPVAVGSFKLGESAFQYTVVPVASLITSSVVPPVVVVE